MAGMIIQLHLQRPASKRLSFPARPFLSRGLNFLSCSEFAKSINPHLVCSSIAVLLLTFSCGSIRAEDWPGVLGPARNGTTTERSFASDEWPETLEPSWTLTLGSGYAGPAIINSAVLIPHRQKDVEHVVAVDRDSGKKLWQSSWNATYQTTMNPDNGPRSVPSATSKLVVCYGAAGDLVCMSLDSGRILWNRALRKEYDAEDGYFGAGSSPLILGELVIVCVGGKEAGIVAIELETGKTRWTATNYAASYASPIAFRRGSETLLLVVTRLDTVLLDARNGAVLSEIRFGTRGPAVNAATPISTSDRNGEFFLTASYGAGSVLLGVEGNQFVERFRDKQLLSSQYNTPVRVASRTFGINGREDVGVASLRALDVEHQEVIWDQPSFGTAHLIGFSKRVLALTLNGKLIVFDALADTYHEDASTQLPHATYRALPALSSNYLLVRATHGPAESELMCFELP